MTELEKELIRILSQLVLRYGKLDVALWREADELLKKVNK